MSDARPQRQAEWPLHVAMISLHTSPLAQAGTGDAGGLNVYVDALSRALRRAGTAVDIITTTADHPSGSADDTVTVLDDGRTVHTLNLGAGRPHDKADLVADVPELAERARRSLLARHRDPVDVVHSHYWISGLAGLHLASRLGVPVVHTMHTIGAVKTERDPAVQEDPRRQPAEARIAEEAATLTANTEHEAADLHRLFGIAPGRVALVPPGVDLEVFSPPEEPDPRTRTSPQGPLRLTFAGRLQTHKGPQVALEALARIVRSETPLDARLTIAGQRSGGAFDVSALATRLGIAEHVTALGPLPQEDLAELFRSSDAVLVPSFSESFGLVALEAMACATPVLAHRVGGLTDLIEDGVTGWLLDSLDSRSWAERLGRLAASRAPADGDPAWSSMSRAAARRARDYSWERTAELAQTVYRRAMQPERGGTSAGPNGLS